VNPYVDAVTGTPRNKLGVTDNAELAKVEYIVTDLRIAQLRMEPIKGAFDLDHLRKIHRHIFQDIYDWAGKERTLNFSKGDPNHPGWKSVFAPKEQIALIGELIAKDLKDWNYLKGTDQPEFVQKLAATYVKLNYMHPFPEGNGRATQTFLSQLATDAGYRLDFSQVSATQWNRAAARSMPQVNVREPALQRPHDVTLIHEVFQRVTSAAPNRELAPSPPAVTATVALPPSKDRDLGR
jgi:cell filamentation protein